MMEQDDNFILSQISAPEPSELTSNNFLKPSQFQTLLRTAHQKRVDADQNWDSLVELLVTEFSKQAAMISKLKMEG